MIERAERPDDWAEYDYELDEEDWEYGVDDSLDVFLRMRGWLAARRDEIPRNDNSDRWFYGGSRRTRVYVAPIVGIAPVEGRAYEVITWVDGEPLEPQWFSANLQAFALRIPEIERRADMNLGLVRVAE
ncbi:hypothetical protein [Microbacterium sp.]|uniref:hypothetical protein n=1 Tax=Microbacterium sp. TaxID=51671 RepID=UPI002734E995|nr:hypothetical protein [Microbacterium sp.]MDP3952987.1 hypothetical protein [Microbacterium sp.]